MVVNIAVLVLSVIAVVLLLIANLGTTFDSTFLPKIYLVQINEAVNGRAIRYGIYRSCLYFDTAKAAVSCTVSKPGYTFDAVQFAQVCGAGLNNTDQVKLFTDVVDATNLSTFKTLILLMVSVIFAFLSLVASLLMRNFRTSNTVPFIGTFASLIGLICGIAGLALTIFTFWKGVDTLGNRIEGLSVSWGPAIYMVGVGCLALLIDFACFVISLFSDPGDDRHNRETYRMFDYNGASDDTKPMNQTYAISTPNHQTTFDNNYSSYSDQTAYRSQAGYKDQRYY